MGRLAGSLGGRPGGQGTFAKLKSKENQIKFEQQTRYMMQLREEAADFADRLKKLNEHHTIARYKDRNIEQEMADYESKIEELSAALNLKDEDL